MTNRPSHRGLSDEVFALDDEPPCLSLYQPTHRRHPENQQDRIRFRNLVKQLEADLRGRYPTVETQPLLEPFEALGRDREFWNQTLDGLVVLGSPDTFRAWRIPQSVTEMVVVAESFHTKPLRRFLQSLDRYQVLALDRAKVRLFEGNRHTLDELEPVGVPRSIAEALGEELTEPHQTVASYGGVGGASHPMHHGHGGKSNEADIDAERFFRAVDRAVTAQYSKPSGLPLVLAALPEHHHLFHTVSHNPLLVDEGVRANSESLSPDQLRGLAWQAVEPRYRARLTSLLDDFEQARSQGTGSDDLVQVAQGSSSGRVQTLLIEAERHIPGRIDAASGRVDRAGPNESHAADLLDDVSELVVKKGGTVVVIPSAQMPTHTGLAAIYRY